MCEWCILSWQNQNFKARFRKWRQVGWCLVNKLYFYMRIRWKVWRTRYKADELKQAVFRKITLYLLNHAVVFPSLALCSTASVLSMTFTDVGIVQSYIESNRFSSNFSQNGPIPRVNVCIPKHGKLTRATFAAFANNDIILEGVGWWNIAYSFNISSTGWFSNVLPSRNFVMIFASYEAKNLRNDDNNSSSEAI